MIHQYPNTSSPSLHPPQSLHPPSTPCTQTPATSHGHRPGCPCPVSVSPCPQVPVEQLGVGQELLDGAGVEQAEAEHGGGHAPTEDTDDASGEGHGELPRHFHQAAAGGQARGQRWGAVLRGGNPDRPPGPPYLSASRPLKYAWMYSVKAVATGSASCEPSTTGLGPRDSPGDGDRIRACLEPPKPVPPPPKPTERRLGHSEEAAFAQAGGC